jgi:hypothetical protein
MEESGEQCTVVFALIITKYCRLLCVWRGLRGGVSYTNLPPPLFQFCYSLGKDDSALFSRFHRALRLTQSVRLNSYFAVLGMLESPYHSYNYGVRSPKFIWAQRAQLYSLAETPAAPPPPIPHLGSYTRVLLVS